jgi:hypothetical protein
VKSFLLQDGSNFQRKSLVISHQKHNSLNHCNSTRIEINDDNDEDDDDVNNNNKLSLPLTY